MSHGNHQDRELDSGDTGALLRHGSNARQVALVAWSRPKCPNSAGTAERPSVLVRLAWVRSSLELLRQYWAESTGVNTVPGLRGPLDLQIESRGGGSRPNCSRITVA